MFIVIFFLFFFTCIVVMNNNLNDESSIGNMQPMASEVPNNARNPLKNDFIFLLVIVSIILPLSLYAGSLINIIVYSIQLVGFVFGIRMASKQKRGAGYIGLYLVF